MNIALVDCNPKVRRYNIGLLRIGTYLKRKGHICTLYQNNLPKQCCDEIWISTQFTFNIPHALELARNAKDICKHVRIGGTAASLLPEKFIQYGFDTHIGIIPEADECIPDYSLLNKIPVRSITATSRGCIRKCQFCMVHRLEPEFYDKPNWYLDIHRSSTQIDLYDNNWLAKSSNLLERDSRRLHEICYSGRIKRIDFSQALDCRLMTEDKAKLLGGLPVRPIRFSFDNMSEDVHFQNAIEIMVNHGFKSFTIYLLWNFNDTPQDYYYRLKQTHILSQGLNIQVVAFPMRYQPILEMDAKREYVGKYWTQKMKKALSASFMYFGGTKGQISLFGKKGYMTPIENFEYWFGRNENEFVDILNIDNIRGHWKFKQGLSQAGRADTDKPQIWHKFWDEFKTR